MERLEAEERERRLHDMKASNREILSGESETTDIDSVSVHRHVKPGKPDSIRVEYRCGLQVFREWVCLDHEGLAGRSAHNWWRKRFGEPIPNVTDALSDMFLADAIKEVTNSITIQRKGKYTEIIGHELKRVINEHIA